MKKIKILLADDTLIAREGWKRILETAPDIEVVGEAETAAETSRKVNELKPDVLLMDLYWFGDETAGWTTIKDIKSKHKVKIIAITAYENLIKDARYGGADSALLKTFTREQLLSEIREQAAKQDDVVFPIPTPFSPEKLTERESEVLGLVEQGHSDKDIARFLGIADTTAKNHVKSILEKLGAKNRTQAVSLARQKGLIK